MLKTLGAQIREFKKDSLLTPVFMILEVFMETIIPLMMASIIDQGVEAGNIHHIYVMGAWMVVAACFSLFCGVMGGKYGARASAGFARNLRKAMYENIQSFSFSNIDKFSTAGLVTRLTTDVTNLQNAYQMLLRMCVRAPISLICAMCMAFFISPRLASIYLVAVIILGIILAIITVRAHHYFMEVFPKYDDLNASVQENVSAIRVVKAYVREDHETSKFHKAAENIYKIFCKAEENLSFNAPLMQLTVYSCILLISWLGAKMIVGSSLTTGELMSLLTYCMNILMSLMMLSMVFVMVTMSIASAERVTEVLNEKADICNPENPVMEVKDGSVVFDHVDFRYKKDAPDYALKGIDLSIRSGETIGIIGGTGSSKSSLVNLISRFYNITSGTVRVDGHSLTDVSINSLRAQMGVMTQDNFLFSGTIRDNIAYGKLDATEEEIIAAAKAVHAHDFIIELPDGYDTEISERGARLSNGQRQLLAFARTMVSDPRILILDEATSSIDTQTEIQVQQGIESLLKGRTSFIIAHRLSTIKNADRIFVIDHGKIFEQGTHDELMAKQGAYYQLYQAQFRRVS